MSVFVEAQTLVRLAAEPPAIGDSVKAAIGRSARRLGFSFSRTKDIWYADARRIDAAEIDRLREVAGRKAATLAITHLVEAHRLLAQACPNEHRNTIAVLGSALNDMGHEVRSVAFQEG